MTALAEPPLDARWRARVESLQEAALPPDRVVVTCAAAPGVAGLGRHLQEILDALERRGQPGTCISAVSRARADNDAASPPLLGLPGVRAALTPLGRLSPSWRVWKARMEFDAYAARRLPAGDHLLAFNGQALTQFRTARQRQYASVALVSGGVHVRRLARRHAVALRRYPLERSHTGHLPRRYLREYARADRIFVASRYSWESFAEEGIAEEVLSLFPLTPDPRFRPDPARQAPATFDVVYVGGLSVAKGVPLLIDAVRRLAHPDLRLVLVGGWASRGMRRFIQRSCAQDPRIRAAPGDPLAHLRRACLAVHPSYADGFSYGAAEALACGLPVIVSEDTGMKELIEPGRNGLILPTGEPAPLTEAIDAAYRGEILGD